MKRARLEAGLSQDALAKRIRAGGADQWFDQAYISRLERGLWDVKIRTLSQISQALGVTVAHLVEVPPPPAMSSSPD